MCSDGMLVGTTDTKHTPDLAVSGRKFQSLIDGRGIGGAGLTSMQVYIYTL